VLAAEGIGHRLDPSDRALQLRRIAVESPAAEEFNLHDAQAGVDEHSLHVLDVETGCDGPGKVVDVQPDSAEARPGGRRTAIDEGVPGWLTEAGPGQGETVHGCAGPWRARSRRALPS
jgi:hypothetical protein